MARNIFSRALIGKMFILLLILTESTACFFKRQHAGKPEKLQKKGATPSEKTNVRDVDESCECGSDAFYQYDPETDQNLKQNSPQKSWHFYIHIKNGPNLANDRVRTCTGTIINSKMGLTSHNCIKLQNESVPVYEAWRPQPKSMAKSPLPTPEDLVITLSPDITDTANQSTFKVADIIYNSKFIYSDAHHYPIVENDMAIIVFKDEWPIKDEVPICVPENYPRFNPTGYHGYYYGLGGGFDGDPYPASRFVGDLVIMPGKLCDADSWNQSLCVQYRPPPPTFPGGPLVMSKNGTLNKRGYTPGQTVFLIGLASLVIKPVPGTHITSTIFTNVLPLVKYLEYYANNVSAKWCKTPRFQFAGKRLNPKAGLVKLYPWEDTKSFPKANYLDREETLDCVCGLHNLETWLGGGTTRIIGGEVAKPYEFPWMVAYKGYWDAAQDLPKTVGGRCGASIINDRVILIASHCVVNVKRIGRFPEEQSLPNRTKISYRLHKESGDDKVIVAEVEEIFYHMDFTLASRQSSPFDGDIALIVLKKPITFSGAKRHGEAKPGDVRPICLPKRDKTFPVEGRSATVVGWGVTPIKPEDNNDEYKWIDSPYLQKLEHVPIYPLKFCGIRTTLALSDSSICAGFWNNSKDFTRGDSGGPLAVRTMNGFWTQVGIVSFYQNSYDFSDPSNPTTDRAISLYTNVQKYLQFIDFVSKKVGAKWCTDNS